MFEVVHKITVKFVNYHRRYMSSRLYTILNLIYMPLYLEERLQTNDNDNSIRGAIASVPLMCFLASFATSLAINNRPNFVTDKVLYSSLHCLITKLIFYLGNFCNWKLYFVDRMHVVSVGHLERKYVKCLFNGGDYR